MSRKAKSELSFILKIFLLFIILFSSKLHKSDRVIADDKSIKSKKDSVFVINTYFENRP